jgi:branched-chain amino acid transport system permease protein
VNILVGYCGQITLGAGASMAVGAYAAYNFLIRVDGMPALAAITARRVSCRPWQASSSVCRACACAAYISRWQRWRRSSSGTGPSCASSGSPTTPRRATVSVANINVIWLDHQFAQRQYLFCLGVLVVFA